MWENFILRFLIFLLDMEKYSDFSPDWEINDFLSYRKNFSDFLTFSDSPKKLNVG
jgi:hypothetical protein